MKQAILFFSILFSSHAFSDLEICKFKNTEKRVELINDTTGPCFVYYNNNLSWTFRDLRDCQNSYASLILKLEKGGFKCLPLEVDYE